jgi:hypothetical protein
LGQVWVPANRSRDWRPYTVGRWTYTDEWGWYWIEDASEVSWGTVTYHYGRWIYDDDVGWCWLAGNEWAPAWVLWRRGQGAEYVGWAPLPPDDIVVDYYEAPGFWIFVRGRDFVAPSIASVILPVQEYDVYLQHRGREPNFTGQRSRVLRRQSGHLNVVAAFSGQPVRSFNVTSGARWHSSADRRSGSGEGTGSAPPRLPPADDATADSERHSADRPRPAGAAARRWRAWTPR